MGVSYRQVGDDLCTEGRPKLIVFQQAAQPDWPVSRAFVDARIQTIYGGINEVMKELIARSIVRQNWEVWFGCSPGGLDKVELSPGQSL